MNTIHPQRLGSARSSVLATLNEGASLKGAGVTLRHQGSKAVAEFLGVDLATVDADAGREQLIATLRPLVADHERDIQAIIVRGLHQHLPAAMRSRVRCTCVTIGQDRLPMSNFLTLMVATDKPCLDADQVWCSFSVDLDRPAGRSVELYGARTADSIVRLVRHGSLVTRAASYPELAEKLAGHFREALLGFEADAIQDESHSAA